MSEKQKATYHGADVVTRLRAYGPESDYDGVMQEAAQEIEKLRAGVEWGVQWEEVGAFPVEIHKKASEQQARDDVNTSMFAGRVVKRFVSLWGPA